MTPAAAYSPYRPLLIAASVVLTVAALSWAKTLLIPFALSVLLSFILTPPVRALQNRGLRRMWAVALIVLVTLCMVAGLVAALAVQLHDLAGDVVANKENILRKTREVMGDRPGVVAQLFRLADEVQADLRKPDSETPAPAPQQPIEVKVREEQTSSWAMAPHLVEAVYNNIGTIGLVIALTVSILLTREDLRNRVIGLIGGGALTSTTRAFDDATRRIGRYLLVQVLLNAGFGALFGVALALIGVDYALLWGFLAAVLRFIPYVGTWLAAAPPLIVSLTIGAWQDVAVVSVLVVLLGIATNNIIEPLLVSRSTEVAPFSLVASAAFWTWLWGPIGLILATPMTVCLSVLGRYVPGLGFLDMLLGSRSVLEPDLALYQRLLAHDVGEAEELLENYRELHTLDEMADGVIIPALVRLRADEDRNELTPEDTVYILRTLREVLEGHFALDEAADDAQADVPPAIIGCPAHDEREELALLLLQQMLGPKRARMTVLTSKLTAAEVVQTTCETAPALVCIITLSPRTQAQARYICKRLKARCPQQPILVADLGGDEDLKEEPLRAAGATLTAPTLQAALRHILTRLQLQPAVANEPANV
jgi:predicted PurR-regulated permease PerM